MCGDHREERLSSILFMHLHSSRMNRFPETFRKMSLHVYVHLPLSFSTFGDTYTWTSSHAWLEESLQPYSVNTHMLVALYIRIRRVFPECMRRHTGTRISFDILKRNDARRSPFVDDNSAVTINAFSSHLLRQQNVRGRSFLYLDIVVNSGGDIHKFFHSTSKYVPAHTCNFTFGCTYTASDVQT